MRLGAALRVVGPVERSVRVRAGTGVVAAHDEMRAAVVLTDDRVPYGLSRPAHPHREREQRKPAVSCG